MAFDSLEYAIFLAIALIVYYALSFRLQNLWLLALSYLFYGWWDWRFTLLLLISTVCDFYIGRALFVNFDAKRRRRLLLASIAVNLGILGFFKYFNFFRDSLVELAGSAGIQLDVPTLYIILPVGISFYTFQTLTYTVEIYRGNLQPAKRFSDFALYVAFFPQLVAGPIERANNLLPQIESLRSVDRERFASGCLLILTGLFRKVVIANQAGQFADSVFNYPDIYPWLGLVLGVWMFALQIYADFGGYSDIARGTARLLGFELMENFQQPYFRTNITDFWRTWHVSLSTWLRDYLYIPLGGNRCGTVRNYANLMITMTLGGLWHGASWTFVAWGVLHGVYLSAHKGFRSAFGRLPSTWHVSLICWFITLQLVCITWIFFRSPDFATAWEYLQGIITLRGSLLDTGNPGKVLKPLTYFVLLAAALVMVDFDQFRRRSHTAMLNWPVMPKTLAYSAMALAVMLFIGSDDRQFIYFQF